RERARSRYSARTDGARLGEHGDAPARASEIGAVGDRVLLFNALDRIELSLLLERYGLDLVLVAPEEIIPGSYWGEREAGLIGSKIYARLDTPLHSVLHEGAHFICMTPERRAARH